MSSLLLTGAAVVFCCSYPLLLLVLCGLMTVMLSGVYNLEVVQGITLFLFFLLLPTSGWLLGGLLESAVFSSSAARILRPLVSSFVFALFLSRFRDPKFLSSLLLFIRQPYEVTWSSWLVVIGQLGFALSAPIIVVGSVILCAELPLAVNVKSEDSLAIAPFLAVLRIGISALLLVLLAPLLVDLFLVEF